MHKRIADLEVYPSMSLNCSRGAVNCFGYEQWPLRLLLRALALQKGTAKRISDVYLSIKVYVGHSDLCVRTKNQVEPETLREVLLLWLGQQNWRLVLGSFPERKSPSSAVSKSQSLIV